MVLFPKLRSFEYKIFKLKKKWLYVKTVLSQTDYDWESLIQLLIFKLTMMGLQFAKFSFVCEESRKKQVRTIWEARRNLKRCLAAEDIGWEYAEKQMKKLLKDKFKSIEDFLDVIAAREVVDKGELTAEEDKVLHEVLYRSDIIRRESVKKAFKIINANIFNWWD